MRRNAWVKRITNACQNAGTYKDYFDDVIETLAGILEKRDMAEKAFKNAGSEIIVQHTNKGGSTNLEQNPMIRLINDLNRDALAYWRDLGLTPKGLKALNDSIVQEKESTLERALSKLGGALE